MIPTGKVKIQARELVRYARRNKLKIARFGLGWNTFCARALVCHAFLGPKGFDKEFWNIYNTYPEIPLTQEQLDSLEAGFEGYDGDDKNGYYKMGQRVAKLAGLSDK